MRNNYIGLLALLIGLLSFQEGSAQNSFALLDEAEVLIKNDKYNQALSKIIHAEKSKYCTCGDCFFQVNKKANLLRYSIYSKIGDYELSRQSLDSIYLSYGLADSLKVLSYQSEYGKDFLSEQIETALINSTIDCGEYDCYAEIPLSGKNKALRFKIDNSKTIEYSFMDNENERNEKWRKKFLGSSIYKMIKTEN